MQIWGFLLCGFEQTYVDAVTTRAAGACCGGDSYRFHRCDVVTKVGYRQTPYKTIKPSRFRLGFIVLRARKYYLPEVLTIRRATASGGGD